MLHEWTIEERDYRRHEDRRGRRHAFTEILPKRSALVVVDMVPFFVDENPYAKGIVPNIQNLARAVRWAGGVVAWVLPATTHFDSARAEFYGARVAELYRTSGAEGSPQERLWHEFDIADLDLVVEKRTPGAFFPGGCDLDEMLRELGIDTVLVAGTVANVCCESTVREAAASGFRTVMVADANAAMTDADLNATLRTVYRSFGDVRTVSELVGLLENSNEDASDSEPALGRESQAPPS